MKGACAEIRRRVKAMKNTKNKLKWFDNNPFFLNKDEYGEFVEKTTEAARQNNLPICFGHNDPESLTPNDIKQLSLAFRRDTGLNLDCQFYTCKDCGRLHCSLIVDQ